MVIKFLRSPELEADLNHVVVCCRHGSADSTEFLARTHSVINPHPLRRVLPGVLENHFVTLPVESDSNVVVTVVDLQPYFSDPLIWIDSYSFRTFYTASLLINIKSLGLQWFNFESISELDLKGVDQLKLGQTIPDGVYTHSLMSREFSHLLQSRSRFFQRGEAKVYLT